MPKKVFIGVAWPYVNGKIHIGHLAGYLLPADIFARFQRYLGNDVLMVSGSDAHGTPITIEADERGLTPEDIVKEYHIKNVDLFNYLKLTFDIFTITTTETHKKVVQDVFLAALKKGYIFKKKTNQYYSPQERRFLPDRYVEGTCPYCGYEYARSDQCERCGRVLEQGELKKPRSRRGGGALELKETEHYFFDWPKLEKFLSRYVEEKGRKWRGWVLKETKKWLKEGLKPRAITRDIEWGVEIPTEKIPEKLRLDNPESKRIYVWFEAVIGYLSASIEWSKNKKGDWKDFWYNKEALHYYFMGKDNLVFHTLFWPGEIYVYDKRLHLPDVLAINQFLNLEGKKFSKSRGVILDSREVVEKYGLDPVRFYLTLIMPERADTNFSWNDFVKKHNGVLIGNLGNFINRTLAVGKEFNSFNSDCLEKEAVKKTISLVKQTKNNLSAAEFRKYSENIVSLADFGNKYLSKKKPWAESMPEKKKHVITNALYILLALQLITKPLLIETSSKLADFIGVDFEKWPDDEHTEFRKILSKIKIKNPRPLFTKIK